MRGAAAAAPPRCAKVPPLQDAGVRPRRSHARKMLLLEGCVQPAMSPNINAATARVFDRLGIELVTAREAGCCGAIRYHTGDHAGGLDHMRRNIDAWWPHIEAGAEAIVMTASGCGALVKEYGHLLRDDARYAERARRVSALTRDLSEVLPDFADELQAQAGTVPRAGRRVAYHPPCTLQHGQQIRGKVEALLGRLGIEVRRGQPPVLRLGGHLPVLQPELSLRLRAMTAGQLAGLRTGSHRLGQHRLHHAPARWDRDAGDALDRAGGPGAG